MEYLFSQILNGLSLGCIYALVALGFAMVYGVLRLLNFAHSEVFTTGAFMGYFVLGWAKSVFPAYPYLCLGLAIVAAALGAGGLALTIERVAYRPIRNLPRVAALLTAIGMSIFIQNVGIKLFGAHSRGYPTLDLGVSPRVLTLTVLCLSYGALHFLVYRTRLGIQMRAVSEDPPTAELMGIDSNRVISAAFIVGGVFAGIAGVLWGLQYSAINPQMGFYPGLKAFIIAVVGSIGNLRGAFVMGVCLGLLEVLGSAYLPSELSPHRDSLIFGMLVLLLIVKPTGLLGATEPEKV